uniref:cell division protein ZapD n=1 Tax=Thaumasiovibrio occultus TaxID=1891184 RepID=UPI000B34D40C|nr:cell division protein ZapD [Thaumasiovibrio occultus]
MTHNTEQNPTFVRYEHPLNERVRTYLRFESLLSQLHGSRQLEQKGNAQLFFKSLFDILELLDQIQIKADLLKDLDKQRSKLKQWLDYDNVDQSMLSSLLNDISSKHKALLAVPRLGQSLREDRFLCAIRQRFSIPGGSCSFDLPGLQHWLYASQNKRDSDIQRWVDDLSPLTAALDLWLRLVRDTGVKHNVVAKQGFYQDDAPDAELLLLEVPATSNAYPVVSGHRSRFAIRFTPFDEAQDVAPSLPFTLTRC